MPLLARFRSTHYVLVFWCGQTPLTGSGRSGSKPPGPGLPHPLSSLSPIDSPTSSGIPVQVISSDANQVTTVLGHLVQTPFSLSLPIGMKRKGLCPDTLKPWECSVKQIYPLDHLSTNRLSPSPPPLHYPTTSLQLFVCLASCFHGTLFRRSVSLHLISHVHYHSKDSPGRCKHGLICWEENDDYDERVYSNSRLSVHGTSRPWGSVKLTWNEKPRWNQKTLERTCSRQGQSEIRTCQF